LCEVLKLDLKETKRIVFHEITEKAIKAAIDSPRSIDMQLVQAQQARQILDRIVGFELSPVVWQKVPGGKSAGRVQSPALRLIVEREREIESFEGSSSFKVFAEFTEKGETIKAELNKRFDSESDARDFLESLIDRSYIVDGIEKSPAKRNPSAPFTTSTLQQEANSRLGFSARSTMSSAQKLYQEGKITYMRTDSVNLAGQAIASAASYIKKEFGEKYSTVRKFKTKSQNAQEAHEAIRPTDMSLENASGNEYDQKLYDLIRRRTLASQMSPATLEKTIIKIDFGDSKLTFEAKGEVVVFDGFLKVYKNTKKDLLLPAVQDGQSLKPDFVEAREVFARPPARYTEGSLVKKLEELGIGRPSTYATILNTIQTRGYAEPGDGEGEERQLSVVTLKNDEVTKTEASEKTGADKGKLVPTPAGKILSDFLTKHFTPVVDYGFTANVEAEFDQIAAGALARNIMLKNFYKPFHELVEESGSIERSSVAQAREIGKDPKSDKPILARFGRYGPMLQMGATEDKEEKPRFAPMPAGAKLETITIEEALKAFELPRVVGKTADGKEIEANIGRFGPYIKVGKLFVSIKPLDPHTITEAEALELYEAKLKAEAEKNIADFGDGVKVLNGRFGPYITNGKKNVKINKDTDPKTISHQQAKDSLAAAPDKKRSTRRHSKSK
jgi:DNA topoisomerase-1